MPTELPERHCPICEKSVGDRAENRHFPFCSSRCKQEDLGHWLGGSYAMPGRPASPDEIAQELVRDHGSD